MNVTDRKPQYHCFPILQERVEIANICPWYVPLGGFDML